MKPQHIVVNYEDYRYDYDYDPINDATVEIAISNAILAHPQWTSMIVTIVRDEDDQITG